MESTMGNEGINKLAAVFQNRMHGMTDKPEVLDFGVIQGDMSLLTNRFPRPIPQKDYMVCRQLTLGPTNNILAKTQDIGMPHSGTHLHKVNGPVGIETGPAPDPPIPSAARSQAQQGKQPVPHQTRPSHRRGLLAGTVRTECTSTTS